MHGGRVRAVKKYIERLGDTHGDYDVAEQWASDKHGNARWVVRCRRCSYELILRSASLRDGRQQKCPRCHPWQTNALREGRVSAPEIIARSWWIAARRHAKRQGRAFDITFEDYFDMCQQHCYLCGIAPSEVSSNKCKGTARLNGVDKMIPADGYVLSNCRPCCWPCNCAKNVFSLEEYLPWAVRAGNGARRILTHRRPKQRGNDAT